MVNRKTSKFIDLNIINSTTNRYSEQQINKELENKTLSKSKTEKIINSPSKKHFEGKGNPDNITLQLEKDVLNLNKSSSTDKIDNKKKKNSNCNCLVF